LFRIVVLAVVPLEKDLEKSEKSQRKHTLDLSLFTKHHLQHVHEIPTNLPPINCSSNSLLLQTYTRCLLALLTAVHALFSSKLKHSILTTLVLLLFSPVTGYATPALQKDHLCSCVVERREDLLCINNFLGFYIGWFL
jgi:hypothetical protein